MSEFHDNYIYRKSQCEVCGDLYPDMVEVGDQMLPIFDFQKPKSINYLLLEVMGMPQGKNFSVIKVPEDYTLEIGRSNCEFQIPDVSISKK